MKPNQLRTYCLPLFLFLLTITMGCKKDQLTINEEKVYAQERDPAVTYGPYDGGWSLTMRPDGVADVLPGGDIYYRGTYKIKGSKIEVKTEQNNETYNFEIISESEIKEKTYGAILKLRK
jgi:hypothetical protein